MTRGRPGWLILAAAITVTCGAAGAYRPTASDAVTMRAVASTALVLPGASSAVSDSVGPAALAVRAGGRPEIGPARCDSVPAIAGSLWHRAGGGRGWRGTDERREAPGA